ncbi:uncharacterized protein GIQ15_03799 [Arthroderma uncinatum]|uniref:uncharacterized protein n=1 Tax=Arthroderma uncinatum TaxID=74035 RepID=UPI00144AEC00|nr:uncharacterized protein GIQ15_03799 [Arthroderma uncinatum]KAF3481040.1 hypothetical protein GIQ15_03799 [Arthroderma uncinatum]
MGSACHSWTIAFQLPPGPEATQPGSGLKFPIYNDGLRVRTAVFVDEQRCAPENEVDEDDGRSWHWVAYDGTVPVGVVRLVPPPHEGHDGHEGPDGEQPFVRIGRLAVLPSYRGKGLARTLVDTALGWAAEHAGEVGAALDAGSRWNGLTLIHAQTAVEAMYARLGFVTDPGMGRWEEEGIPHIGMWKTVEVLHSTPS